MKKHKESSLSIAEFSKKQGIPVITLSPFSWIWMDFSQACMNKVGNPE
jgi:hypothetical protein